MAKYNIKSSTVIGKEITDTHQFVGDVTISGISLVMEASTLDETIFKIMETGSVNTQGDSLPYGMFFSAKDPELSNYPVLAIGDTYWQGTGYGIALEAKNGIYGKPTLQMGFGAQGGALDMWSYRSWQSSGSYDFIFTTGSGGLNGALTRFGITGNADISNVYFINSNVGIGTDTPSTKLDVVGDVKVNGNFLFGSATIPATHLNPDYKFLWFPNAVSIGGDESPEWALISLRSNWARTTNPPWDKYWVYATDGSAWNLDMGHGENLDAFAIQRAPVGNAGDELATHRVTFFKINADGNVGIGTETLTSKLNVSGSIEVLNAADGIILKSPDGSRFRVTIGNDGVLIITEI